MELQTEPDYDQFADDTALSNYIDMTSINMYYYTYRFIETPDSMEYVVHIGDMIQPVYERFARMLDMFYIDIDTIMEIRGITVDSTYFHYTLKIPPLLERRIKRIMDEFNYRYIEFGSIDGSISE